MLFDKVIIMITDIYGSNQSRQEMPPTAKKSLSMKNVECVSQKTAFRGHENT